MEKLIELLNEYEVEKKPSRLQRNYYLCGKGIMYIDEEGEDVDDYRTDYEIISKEYGFIKWLVDNDKIDTDELLDIYWETSQSIWEDNKYELYPEYERLLMLLAIHDEPINLLIRVLK